MYNSSVIAHILFLIFTTSLQGRYWHYHFTDKKTEAARHWLMGLRSHSPQGQAWETLSTSHLSFIACCSVSSRKYCYIHFLINSMKQDYPHLTDEEAKAKRSWATCPRSCGWLWQNREWSTCLLTSRSVTVWHGGHALGLWQPGAWMVVLPPAMKPWVSSFLPFLHL